jgi:hypothetical protein
VYFSVGYIGIGRGVRNKAKGSSGIPDVLLCNTDRSIQVIVEVKKPIENLNHHVAQLKAYMLELREAHWGLLTNGREWRLYQRHGKAVNLERTHSIAELEGNPELLALLERRRGTAIGEGLRESAGAFPTREGKADGPAVVILLSDGRNITGVLPKEAALVAKKLGVKVHTIGVCSTTTTPTDAAPFAGFDESELRGIAETTGGRYYAVGSAERLEEVYRELGREIGWPFLLLSGYSKSQRWTVLFLGVPIWVAIRILDVYLIRFIMGVSPWLLAVPPLAIWTYTQLKRRAQGRATPEPLGPTLKAEASEAA